MAFLYLSDGEHPDQLITYGALDRAARALAITLQERGLTGARAMLLYPPGLDFLVGFFGCIYAGAVAVPVFPPRRNRNMNRLQSIAQDAQASVALTVSGVSTKLGQLTASESTISSLQCIFTDELDLTRADDWRGISLLPHDLAILQYTSGSTGNPRGVMLSHQNILHNCDGIQRGFGAGTDDIGLSWLPTYHDMGLVGGILSPIYFGAQGSLMSPMAFLQRPARWLRAISQLGATISGAPNFAYDLCVKKIEDDELVGVDLSRWQVAFNGAEPIRASTLRRFAERFAAYGFREEAFYPCYGLAESTLMVTGGTRMVSPTIARIGGNSIDMSCSQSCSGDAVRAREVVSSGFEHADDLSLRIVDPETQSVQPSGRDWRNLDQQSECRSRILWPTGTVRRSLPGTSGERRRPALPANRRLGISDGWSIVRHGPDQGPDHPAGCQLLSP